jgi:hypothetical protein
MQMGAVVFNTVLPVIVIRGTTLLFISSAAGDPNCVGMRLLSSRLPNGKPIVDIYTVGSVDGLAEALQSLAIHTSRGVVKGGSEELRDKFKQNIHNLGIRNEGKSIRRLAEIDQAGLLKQTKKRSDFGSIAPHQSIVNQQILEAMMTPEAFRTEILNEAGISRSSPVFPINRVMELCSGRNNYDGNEHPEYVYVTLDTAAGGKTSDTAWVSTFMTSDDKLVVSSFLLTSN